MAATVEFVFRFAGPTFGRRIFGSLKLILETVKIEEYFLYIFFMV